MSWDYDGSDRELYVWCEGHPDLLSAYIMIFRGWLNAGITVDYQTKGTFTIDGVAIEFHPEFPRIPDSIIWRFKVLTVEPGYTARILKPVDFDSYSGINAQSERVVIRRKIKGKAAPMPRYGCGTFNIVREFVEYNGSNV